MARDVHERVEAGRRIAESERAFREVFDASPVGLAVLDAHGRFTDVNDAFCLLAGRTREAVLATVYEGLLHPEDRAAAVISRARGQNEGAPHTAAERRLTRADGSMIWVRVRTSEIAYSGDVRTLVSIEDVTSAKATEDQLRHDALHDELTGLPNRRLLIDRLERAITRSRRAGSRLAVYFIDLDDLKRVNDTHPWQHRAGDVLLTATATAVRDTLRGADTLGRLGGDEFVAICEDVGDDSTIADLGERILQALRRPLTIGGETVLVGASVGVAVTDDDTETAEQLLGRADAAMYAAKTAGGSRVVRSDPVGEDAGVDLVGALDRRELRLHYQPVVSLLSGSVLGVATVIKWRHPERGMLPATEVRAAIGAGAASLPVVHWAIERAISDVRTVAPSRVEHVSVWLPIPGRAALAASTRTAVVEAIAGPDGTLGADSAPSLVLDVHEQDIAALTKRQALHHHLHELIEEGPLALGIERFTADAVPVGMLQLLSARVGLDRSRAARRGGGEQGGRGARAGARLGRERARRHHHRDGRRVLRPARRRARARHPGGVRRPHRPAGAARHLLRPAPRRADDAARAADGRPGGRRARAGSSAAGRARVGRRRALVAADRSSAGTRSVAAATLRTGAAPDAAPAHAVTDRGTDAAAAARRDPAPDAAPAPARGGAEPGPAPAGARTWQHRCDAGDRGAVVAGTCRSRVVAVGSGRRSESGRPPRHRTADGAPTPARR